LSSIYYKPLPSTPNLVPAATASAWMAENSPTQFGNFTISEDETSPNDGGDPFYDMVANAVPMIVSCSNTSWAADTCKGGARNLNGATINVLPAGAPREGTTDKHIAGGTATAIDNFWDASTVPASGGTLKVGGGGECLKSGDGTGCSGATATDIALPLGLVQANELLGCMQSTNTSCVLPHAISVAFRCNASSTVFVKPATSSDGQCFNPKTGVNQSTTSGLPEGTRGAINETDAQVNALYPYNSFQAIIYRTMDRQHYGFVNRDAAWSGGSGIQIQYQSGSEFKFEGKHDPWQDIATLSKMQWNGSAVQFNMGWAPPLEFCGSSGC
jgi:hypothetical protein